MLSPVPERPAQQRRGRVRGKRLSFDDEPQDISPLVASGGGVCTQMAGWRLQGGRGAGAGTGAIGSATKRRLARANDAVGVYPGCHSAPAE